LKVDDPLKIRMPNRVDESLEEPLVLHEYEDGIATLTLNRPANFNALSSAMIAALQSALDTIAERSDVRVVVIAARGRAFCAGHDLRELRAHADRAFQRALFDRCSAMMMAIASLPQPVIAKVHGIATAAGCQLVAACDLAVASTDARFATSGINLGLFCSTPAVALTRVVGAKHAAEMLFTGEFISATDAVRYGLINRAVAANQLDVAATELAQRIASQSRTALTSGKQLLRQLRQTNNDTTLLDYQVAAENMACDMESVDAQLGIDAFLSKSVRAPWTHQE
jgi:enoyl-CoA hydratase/carnithine racemase